MRPPPTLLARSACWPVMRVWTMKAITSSRDLMLVTRLGEINWRDLVRLVKPTSPDKARPVQRAQDLAEMLTTCQERMREPGCRRL